MRLEDFSLNDLDLAADLLADPAVMADLGGPLSPERVAQAQKDYVNTVETEEGWVLKIVPDGSTDAAGLAFLWDRPWGDGVVTEVGVQILGKQQRRGLAGAALRLLLDRARDAGRCKAVHAFPPAASAAAQSLCATLGFRKGERCELPFGGAPVRRVHWSRDL